MLWGADVFVLCTIYGVELNTVTYRWSKANVSIHRKVIQFCSASKQASEYQFSSNCKPKGKRTTREKKKTKKKHYSIETPSPKLLILRSEPPSNLFLDVLVVLLQNLWITVGSPFYPFVCCVLQRACRFTYPGDFSSAEVDVSVCLSVDDRYIQLQLFKIVYKISPAA